MALASRIRPGGRNTHQNMHRTPQNTQRVLGARIYGQYGCTIPISGVGDVILASGNPICKEAKPTNIEPRHTLPQTLDAPNQKSGSAALKLTSIGPTYSIVVAVGSILAPFVVSPDQWGPFFGI